MGKRKIVGINGSAGKNSANLAILHWIGRVGEPDFDLQIIATLSDLPHFQPERTENNVPPEVVEFRNRVEKADGIIISTPEYVFSIPSVLKNAIEWCIATTVFANKPIGLITAAANGEKGHEELQLIMQTIQTQFTDETTLLIPGIKGKIDTAGVIKDPDTENKLKEFVQAFSSLVQNNRS